MAKLGVNIDHAATLRQARRGSEPDIIKAIQICEQAGADAIVCHLREDRRHIQDADIFKIKRTVTTKFIFELSLDPKIVEIAKKVKPDQAMFVPERRQEVTTEGGLDVKKNLIRIDQAFSQLRKNNIKLCLFIDPKKGSIDLSKKLGANSIELHTGHYADAKNAAIKKKELNILNDMTQYAHSQGLIVNAGHGLKYHDAGAVARIKNIHELNIGHSIISNAVFWGLEKAVRDMLTLVKGEHDHRNRN